MRFLQTRLFGVRFIVILLSIYWVAMFLGTHLSNPPPIAESLGDKSMHFGGYLGLTVLLNFSLIAYATKRRLVTIAIIIAIYGALDERTQSLVPGRFTDVNDYVADLCGMILGIGMCWMYSVLATPHKDDEQDASAKG